MRAQGVSSGCSTAFLLGNNLAWIIPETGTPFFFLSYFKKTLAQRSVFFRPRQTSPVPSSVVTEHHRMAQANNTTTELGSMSWESKQQYHAVSLWQDTHGVFKHELSYWRNGHEMQKKKKKTLFSIIIHSAQTEKHSPLLPTRPHSPVLEA